MNWQKVDDDIRNGNMKSRSDEELQKMLLDRHPTSAGLLEMAGAIKSANAVRDEIAARSARKINRQVLLAAWIVAALALLAVIVGPMSRE